MKGPEANQNEAERDVLAPAVVEQVSRVDGPAVSAVNGSTTIGTDGAEPRSVARPRDPRRGFSLLEAMIAVVLVASLSGAVFTFLFNLGRQREGVHGATDALRGATAFIEGLEADALGVVAGSGTQAGIVGDETSLRLLTRGIAAPVAGGAGGGVGGDLQGVEYRFSEGQGTLTARRWDATGAGSGGASGGGEQAATLAVGVSRVRLRYFDGSAWSASFDSGRDEGLPVAIEVAIWFGGASGTGAAGAGSETADAGGGIDEDSDGAGFDVLPPLSDELEADAEGGDAGEILPAPDRVRIIVIPDGPVSAWRDGT